MTFAFALQAEIIDRVAVRVDKFVITESEVRKEIRLVALIEAGKADFSAESRRRTAERLVDQWLIRREMEISRKPPAEAAELDRMYSELIQERFGGVETRYRAALAEYRLRDQDVREHLLRQFSIVRFLSVRFRPGVQITEPEIEDYFQREIVPKLRAEAEKAGKPQAAFVVDDYRDDIERKLVEQRVDQQAEEWLKGTRERTFIQFVPEAFQ